MTGDDSGWVSMLVGGRDGLGRRWDRLDAPRQPSRHPTAAPPRPPAGADGAGQRREGRSLHVPAAARRRPLRHGQLAPHVLAAAHRCAAVQPRCGRAGGPGPALLIRPAACPCGLHAGGAAPHHPPLGPPPPAEDGKEGGAGGASGSAPSGAVQQRMSDFVLPACDSKALCAYLALFK